MFIIENESQKHLFYFTKSDFFRKNFCEKFKIFFFVSLRHNEKLCEIFCLSSKTSRRNTFFISKWWVREQNGGSGSKMVGQGAKWWVREQNSGSGSKMVGQGAKCSSNIRRKFSNLKWSNKTYLFALVESINYSTPNIHFEIKRTLRLDLMLGDA